MRLLLLLVVLLHVRLLAADAPKPKEGGLEDLFKLGLGVIKAADEVGQGMLGLSADEEAKVGAELNKLIMRKLPVYEEAATLARVRRLAEPFLVTRKRKAINYNFTLLEASETNAFSHLGGYVYLNRGILKFAGSDAELQFVLGHEIAHIDLGQCTRKVTYAARAAQVAGDFGRDIAPLVQAAYSVLAVGFSQTEEFAADEWAYRLMRANGRSPKEGLALAERFAELPASANLKARETPFDDLLENHFRTHPPASARLARLSRLER